MLRIFQSKCLQSWSLCDEQVWLERLCIGKFSILTLYKGGHYSFIYSTSFKNELLLVKNVLYEKRKLNEWCVFFIKETLFKMLV